MNSATVKNTVFIDVTMDGLAVDGPISVPGVKAGDVAIQWLGGDGTALFETSFAPMTISVDDQIQQNTQTQLGGRDLSGTTFRVLLVRLS